MVSEGPAVLGSVNLKTDDLAVNILISQAHLLFRMETPRKTEREAKVALPRTPCKGAAAVTRLGIVDSLQPALSLIMPLGRAFMTAEPFWRLSLGDSERSEKPCHGPLDHTSSMQSDPHAKAANMYILITCNQNSGDTRMAQKTFPNTGHSTLLQSPWKTPVSQGHASLSTAGADFTGSRENPNIQDVIRKYCESLDFF